MKIKSYRVPIIKGSPEEINEACKVKDTPHTIGYYMKPPQDLEEFKDRVRQWLEDLKNLGFGFSHEIGTSKTIKRDNSLESLAGLLTCKKHHQKSTPESSEEDEAYLFLKLILEKDGILRVPDWYLLGIERDLSGLSFPQKNAIAVQCAAQALWYVYKHSIPTVKAMTQILLDKKKPFLNLLKLNGFNERTVENWVRKVFPIPQEDRKHKILYDITCFNNVISIFEIVTEKGVSFSRLSFAVMVLTKVFKALERALEDILQIRPITLLAEQVRFYPVLYVKDWVKEAYLMNGSIYSF